MCNYITYLLRLQRYRGYKSTDECTAPLFIYYLEIYLSRAIMTMDARDQFPVDMVVQMLKFTPSPEERALLDEHAEEIDHLARADRFLFELSK